MNGSAAAVKTTVLAEYMIAGPSKLPHSVQIVRRARHDVAGAMVLEEARLLRFEPLEEIIADVELDLPRGADDESGA